MTIDGTLELNSTERDLDIPAGSSLDVTGVLDVLVATSSVDVEGTVTTPSLHLHGAAGSVASTGRVNAATIEVMGHVGVSVAGGGRLVTSHSPLSIPNGGQLNTDGNCNAVLVARLALSPGSRTVSRLYSTVPTCNGGLYRIIGPAHLDGELYIDCDTANLGDQRIVLLATAGRTGRFTSVTGAVNVGPNHWQLSYTATQVDATLVAGNV